MKKTIKIYISICLVLLLIDFSLSQDTNTVKYFPLKVGNVWVYQGSGYFPLCNLVIKRKVKVVNTINIISKIYFLFKDTGITISGSPNNCASGGSILFDTLRIDSINGNIYKYSYSGCNYSIHEIMLDSLNVHLYDKIKINCGQDTAYKCTDTNSYTIFGTMKKTKGNRASYFESAWSRSYVKDIGLMTYSAQWMNNYFNCTLVGCYIDGILYGDTSFITGIKQINSKIPDEFSLYPNFPNPFNPITKIKFDIPSGVAGQTFLSIYDILGREIATLVNEKLSPGTYEVEFDGSDYPSGVYFYKLETENFSQTKRMALIK